jgi:hypothetical protein
MVGDLNGDGLAEILVGASGTDRSGVADAGAAFVVWGRATPGGVDLGDPLAGDGKGYVIRGELAGDNAGQAMTWVADLTGDGRSEILVGAPGSDAGGAESGSAYVVWGKADGTLVNLDDVALGLDLPVRREPTGEVVVPHVEARQLVKWDSLVEHGVGLAAEHLDVVPEVGERLGEVPGVDALPPDVGLTAVGEVGDSQRLVVTGADMHGWPGYAQVIVIVRWSISPGASVGARPRPNASGGALCGSTHVACAGSSYTTQWSASLAIETVRFG